MSETGSNGQADFKTEDEALQVLLDADIDKVMSGLDRIIEAAPSYEKLFMRWQRQHWSTEDFDFTVDAEQWNDPDLMTEEERKFMLFGFSQFFLGEERVTIELLPFAIAAPSHEAKAFLTTQISDEAKHMVFFDRFYREVLGMKAEDIGGMLETQRPNVNKDWEKLFDGILHDRTERLRLPPPPLHVCQDVISGHRAGRVQRRKGCRTKNAIGIDPRAFLKRPHGIDKGLIVCGVCGCGDSPFR